MQYAHGNSKYPAIKTAPTRNEILVRPFEGTPWLLSFRETRIPGREFWQRSWESQQCIGLHNVYIMNLVLRSRAARLAGRGDSCASASMKELGCRWLWRFEKLHMFFSPSGLEEIHWRMIGMLKAIFNHQWSHTRNRSVFFFCGVSWCSLLTPDDLMILGVCAKLNAFGQKPAKCCMTIHQIFSVSYLDASLFCAHGQRCMLFCLLVKPYKQTEYCAKVLSYLNSTDHWQSQQLVSSQMTLRLPEEFCWQKKVQHHSVQVFVLKHVGKRSPTTLSYWEGPGPPATTDAWCVIQEQSA